MGVAVISVARSSHARTTRSMQLLLLILALLSLEGADAHGTVTKPAMRYNPSKGRYCPWCQGSQTSCVQDPEKCAPPTPCWGGIPGSQISKQFFGKWKNHVGPDGKPWIDGSEVEQTANAIPIWCPGDAISTHTFVNADHNGVYRWESQLASPGRLLCFRWYHKADSRGMLQVFIPAWQVRTMDTEMLALSQQRIFKYYVTLP